MARQLRPIDLVAPGSLGLNLEQEGNLLSPLYATQADNCVIDTAGRIAARKGYTDQTTTNVTSDPNIETIFEYRQHDGTTEVLVAWDGGIGNDITDPEGNDVSGAVTDASGLWWFQNFNDKVIGFQDGQKPTVYTGTTFATIVESVGTAPTIHNGVGYAGFGRVWGLDSDAQTIKYSGLLDETDWGTVGDAGSIDMANIWTDGTDEVTAINAFNGSLVVFGKRHIVFWNDGQGSALGLDPDFIAVVDVIEGTGCLTQHSVQAVGETDLLYLSRNGVQSLSRIIQERSNPVANLTKYVRNEVRTRVAQEPVDNIRSTYSPEEGFYLLSFPSQDIVLCIDQRRRYIDTDQDEVAVVTSWQLDPYALLTRTNGDILFGFAGEVGTYGGNDDDGTAFRFIYESPWLDIGEDLGNVLKMLKRIGSVIFIGGSQTDILYKWAVDFEETFKTITRTVDPGTSSEWGSGEFGISEWGGGLSLNIIKVPARAKGQYFKLRVEAVVAGTFALQQLELFTKLGRLA